MRTIKVMLSYRGTRYHGFQRQPNAVTVQELLEQQFSRILNQLVTVYGCSRTDTGVHANQFCLHLHTDRMIPCKNLVRAMNGYLPSDISIRSCEDVSENFHARFDCLGKEYVYRIHNHESKNPFLEQLAFHYRRNLQLPMLQETAQCLVGTHDFASFCAGETGPEHQTVRTIHAITMQRLGDEVLIVIRGNGFLYHMVRIIVGTLLDINEGFLPPDAMASILQAKNRTLAGRTAMAHGLYLNRVFYPSDVAVSQLGALE